MKYISGRTGMFIDNKYFICSTLLDFWKEYNEIFHSFKYDFKIGFKKYKL